MNSGRIRGVARGLVIGAIGALVLAGLGLYLAAVYAALIQVTQDIENDQAALARRPLPFLEDDLIPILTIVSAALAEAAALIWSVYYVVPA